MSCTEFTALAPLPRAHTLCGQFAKRKESKRNKIKREQGTLYIYICSVRDVKIHSDEFIAKLFNPSKSEFNLYNRLHI